MPFQPGSPGHVAEHNALLRQTNTAEVVADFSTSTRSGTDITSALNAAIAAGASAPYGRDNAQWQHSATQYRPTIVLPPGRFLVSDLATIGYPSGRIVGAGSDQTILHYRNASAGTLFTFGAFDPAPQPLYKGAAGGWAIEGLTLVNDLEWHGGGLSYGTEGSRTTTAIRDNHCGGFRLRDVRIKGFRYGFAGVSGSDYTTFDRCFVERCDVGIYLGPSSQQVDIHRCQIDLCREGIVIDEAAQGRIASCWLNDHTYSAIVFEVRETSRFGIASLGGGASGGHMQWSVADCWLENAADPALDRVAQYGLIRTRSVGTVQSDPRWIDLRNTYVVAGAPSQSYPFTRSLLRVDNGDRIKLTNTRITGKLDAVVHNASAGTPKVHQADTDLAAGATIPAWHGGAWAGATTSTVFP